MALYVLSSNDSRLGDIEAIYHTSVLVPDCHPSPMPNALTGFAWFLIY